MCLCFCMFVCEGVWFEAVCVCVSVQVSFGCCGEGEGGIVYTCVGGGGGGGVVRCLRLYV